MQVGDAHGGRAHIDTAAVLPEIERRAEDGDVGAWHIPHCSDGVRAERRARRLEWYNSGDRRGGRVVDRTRLESGRTLTGTGSSNLPLSASQTIPRGKPWDRPEFPANCAGNSCQSRVCGTHLLVAVDRNAQDGVGAYGEDFALPRIVAAQLSHDPPLAIHELALLHVAEPGDGGSRR